MIDLAFNFRRFKEEHLRLSLQNANIAGSIVTTPDLFFIVKDIFAGLGDEARKVIHFPLTAEGLIDMDASREIIDENTSHAVISAANFETGVITPLKELTEMINYRSNAAVIFQPNNSDVDPEISRLATKLKDEILEKFPFSRLNGPTDRSLCLPNAVSISFRNMNGEVISEQLRKRGIEVRTGSACAGSDRRPSKTLQVMNVPYDLAMGSIHFSIGPEISEKDVDQMIADLTDIIGKMGEYSF